MMKTFYCTVLGETFLRHADNLSRYLHAAEGQQIARLVISTIANLQKEVYD